jgi:hypothetical protein
MVNPFDLPETFTPFARNVHLGSDSVFTNTPSIHEELSRAFLDTVSVIYFDVDLLTVQDLPGSNQPMFETTMWDMGKDRKVKKMFPGLTSFVRKELYTNIIRGLWSFLLLGCFSQDGRNKGLLLAVKWKDSVTAERVGCFHIEDVGPIMSHELRRKRVRLI